MDALCLLVIRGGKKKTVTYCISLTGLDGGPPLVVQNTLYQILQIYGINRGCGCDCGKARGIYKKFSRIGYIASEIKLCAGLLLFL